MIYCVIPAELADELFDKLTEYYKDNPNVEVIVDRRTGPDRRRGKSAGGKRETRDRRRSRATGTFLSSDPPE
ncbi:MAG TPA: hypothetical protein VFT18_06085 [Gaiellaceae bacterium]|jgi:hypothetical protein|nr:hypothetical protein [Gaiellaceae bacterium]